MHVPQTIFCSIPAGSDANKGFYAFGVPEGKQFNIVAACYWGGDSAEIAQLTIVPAGNDLNDVTIDPTTGMVTWMEQAKGGAAAGHPAAWPAMPGGQNTPLAGPLSIVFSASAANTNAWFCTLYGTVSNLGEGLNA